MDAKTLDKDEEEEVQEHTSSTPGDRGSRGNSNRGRGSWTMASRDLSTPQGAAYRPETNFEKKLKTSCPTQPNYGAIRVQAHRQHKTTGHNGQTITTN